jgi:hypothetical protein
MSTTMIGPTILFPEDYDAQSEFETPSRGYLSNVIVQLADGSHYKVYFTDVARLSQTLADDVQAGREYYSEPNLVILPQVTTEAVRKAVQGLWHDGFFQNFKPL